MTTPAAQFEEVCATLTGEILTQPAAAALATAGRRAIAAHMETIAQLREQLDRYQGRTVYHCTQAQAEQLLASLGTDSEPGAILRATDTGREWVLRERGSGDEPGLWELVTT